MTQLLLALAALIQDPGSSLAEPGSSQQQSATPIPRLDALFRPVPVPDTSTLIYKQANTQTHKVINIFFF